MMLRSFLRLASRRKRFNSRCITGMVAVQYEMMLRWERGKAMAKIVMLIGVILLYIVAFILMTTSEPVFSFIPLILAVALLTKLFIEVFER